MSAQKMTYSVMTAEYRVPDLRKFLSHDIGTFQFVTFYHPWICEAITRLNRDGVPGLLGWPVAGSAADPPDLDQKPTAWPTDPPSATAPDYDPNVHYVQKPYPRLILDFSLPEMAAPYSQYNWELFFFAPLAIAEQLARTQKYDAAIDWLEYIFNPTNRAPLPDQQRYWLLRPFFFEVGKYLGSPLALDTLVADATKIIDQVAAWQDRPFEPHVVAQRRPLAYEKSVVMRYVENLIGWGDQLFRQDTIESINQATQLYVLANDILGPRPEIVPKLPNPTSPTVADVLAQATAPGMPSLADLENLLPQAAGATLANEAAAESAIAIASQARFFCVPPNAQLYSYWSTIDDRLFKVRNCLNIEGVAQQLALFEPPVDPGLLVAARAAGADLASVVAGLGAPLPKYRYGVLAQRALDLCADVRALGAALLAALEKGDAEALARLRSSNEIDLLTAIRDVKQKQVTEAQATIDGLNQGQAATRARLTWYQSREKVSEGETEQLNQLDSSQSLRGAQFGMSTVTSLLYAIPNTKVGSPTTIGMTVGGSLFGAALRSISDGLGFGADQSKMQAETAGIGASQDRRWDEWQNQIDVLTAEMKQLDKQIAAATTRYDIATTELDNHDLQREQAAAVDDFLKNKHTPQELYDWMVEQLAIVYFQSYQLAYDLAKRAEKAWQFDIGIFDSTASFITPGQWESLYRGLLAGERLQYDLKRMEAAYLDKNVRTFEITKFISLREYDPTAFLQLREEGECYVSFFESDFDADYPGHTLRRIKSVALSLPCVTGQFETVHCTLTLLKHTVHVNNTTTWTDPIPVSQMVTSSGQADTGMFEPNLRDDRYLPFEGAGVESLWHLELPLATNTFSRASLSDAIFQIRYQAKPGLSPGGSVPTAAAPVRGRLFSVAADFPDAWEALLQTTPAASTLKLSPALFPAGDAATVSSVLAVARLADGVSYSGGLTVNLTPPGVPSASSGILVAGKSYNGQPAKSVDTGNNTLRGTNADGSTNSDWGLTLKAIPPELIDSKTGRIDPARLVDLILLFYYQA